MNHSQGNPDREERGLERAWNMRGARNGRGFNSQDGANVENVNPWRGNWVEDDDTDSNDSCYFQTPKAEPRTRAKK